MTLPPGATQASRVGGGCINDAFHVMLADGREAFVKSRPDAAPGEFAAEAAGLEWLGKAGALRTPAVLTVDEHYLALEWIEEGRLGPAGAEELGRGLARMHVAGAPCFGDPHGGGAKGGQTSLRIGPIELPNEPAKDWASFYAERRIEPLARQAAERGLLSRAAVSALGRLCERMGGLAGPSEPPARLHGDLWSGNVMADADGRPWLIDPAAYGGHREVDLAMLRLFGVPSERVFAAYEETAPLAEGWRERVELYQLLPLLVHALLFAGSYCASVERVALRYA